MTKSTSCDANSYNFCPGGISDKDGLYALSGYCTNGTDCEFPIVLDNYALGCNTGFTPKIYGPAGKTDDNPVKCPIWEAAGQCAINPDYMLTSCALSCGSLPIPLKNFAAVESTRYVTLTKEQQTSVCTHGYVPTSTPTHAPTPAS
jgi:hypothetical protein